MKIIVVPVDFSPTSINAARYAADMAVSLEAGVSLLHVCATPVPLGEIPVPVESMDELISDAEEELSALKKSLQEKAGRMLTVIMEVRVGDVLTQLKEYCDKLEPFAVVMGPHGKPAIERLLFGSNTLQAITALSWPLLVVPHDAIYTRVQKIGLACDFREIKESMPVAAIRDIVSQFRAELHVVHVSNTPAWQDMHEHQEEFRELRQLLDTLHPMYHFMNRDSIEDGLHEFARKSRMDILIIIPRHHGLLSGLFHKSQTKQVLLHTQLPVL
ncbi:MAG: universal stress protein, partial [Bacteroidetes bacterium]|nr:universal stress protein [Bacteroidota bacterium]